MTVTLMMEECCKDFFFTFQRTYDMSIVSLLCVQKWVSLVKHIKGIYVLLRGATNPMHVFIIWYI